MLFGEAAAGIFVFGIVMAILGTLFGLPEMRARLGISLAQQGTVFLLLYAGIFAATLVAGPGIDAIGNKPILLVASLLVAGAMAGFVYAHTFRAAMVPAVLLGLGGGGLNISTNALVSDLYGERRGPMLNVLGIFYGVGALCIPLLAAVIAGHFTIPQLLWICAGMAGVCAIVFLLMSFPAAVEAQSFSWKDAARVVRYPGVLLIGLLLFCQSGNEASIAGWTSTYAGPAGLGLGPRVATVVLAMYWGSLMLGRLAAAQLLGFARKTQLVIASAVGSVAGAWILIASESTLTLMVGAIVLGLSYASIFPTVLAIAGDAYQKMAGTVFGLLFAIALIGGMTFPWAVGRLAEAANVRAGMVVPLFGAALICLIAFLIKRGGVGPPR
ncbi:MAG TPA: MFS transporter [Candidatus Saccharimonadales bacterium]|nr:MFS transporter [Candidatus Saccharimonadales bacterium]